MKNETFLELLKTVIHFFYYGIFLSIFIVIGLIVFAGDGSWHELLLQISNSNDLPESYNLSTIHPLSLVLNLLKLLSFLAVIYFFKQVADRFSSRYIFHEATSKSLKYMGLSCLCYAVVIVALKISTPFIFGGTVTILSLNFSGFDSTFFIIPLGLLFIYMPQVLKEGNIIQEENKLTI